MAENYIQLLSEGAKVTSDVFGRVDEAMTRNLAVRSDAQKFAVGMTAKAAEFAEETRMNDASIRNMEQTNYLRGQEFLLEQQLAPLKVEESILRLEAYKAQAADRIKTEKFNNFNSIVKGYEPMINSHLLRTMNPDMANEFAQFRGEYMSRVAGGSPFSGAEYQKGLDRIVSKYADAKPTDKAWNARDRFFLSQINPELAQAYDLQNPILKEHKTGLASSYLGMTPAQAGEFMGKYKTLYSNEEWGAIAPARDRYQANQNELELIQKQSTYLETKLATEDDPDIQASTRSQIKALNEKANSLLKVNMALSQNHALGKYGMTSEPIVDDVEKEPIKKDKININSYLEDQPFVLNVPNSKDPFVKAMRQKAVDISNVVTQSYGNNVDPQDTELKDVGFEWFVEKGTGDNPDDRTLINIKSKIESNLEALGNIGDRFTEENIYNIMQKIPTPTKIPVSNVVAERLLADKAMKDSVYPMIDEDGQRYITVGGSSKTWRDAIPGGKESSSYLHTKDRVFEAIQKFPRLEREEAQKEIYAALLTASLSNVVTE